MDEQAWSRYAEHQADATLLVAGNGRVLDANRAASALLQQPAGRLVGTTLAELSSDDSEHVAALLRSGARTREPLPGSLRFAIGDTVRATRCTAMQLRPRSPNEEALVVLRLFEQHKATDQFLALNQRIDDLAREIQRRRAAESRLQAYSERLRVTLASIGDGVIATDAQGAVVLMNGVAEKLTGWPADAAHSRPLDDVFVIVDQSTREPVDSPVAKVLREGTVVGLANHTLLIARDGSECPIDDSAAPIRDAGGEVVGVVLVFRDFSERHALQVELQRKTDTMIEVARRKDEFMSMLAHELRNPLAPLSTGVELLRREPQDSGSVDRIATMMQRQLGHMTRLVDDLLDVARLTQGKIDLRRSRNELEPILQQAVEMVRPLADGRQLSLQLGEVGAPMILEADSTRLVQVFGNLLSNAIKFTGSGGRIGVRVQRCDAGVEIVVSDDGIGIDSALLPQVFELFVQADRSLDRAQGGLGIGLTVVRSIVEMHGGTVTIASAGSGLGTEVTVHLPLVDAAQAAASRGATALESVDAPCAGKPGFGVDAQQQRVLRVLVVDDNDDAGQMLSALLDLWGHEATVVTDGIAALEACAHWQPQVVLLDIGLPGISGHEVARRLRRTRSGRSLRLVAITGYGACGVQQASRDAGFDEHLTKPVDLDRLQSLLAEQAQRLWLLAPS